MADSKETQLEALRQSIQALESQRSEIGDEAIEPALTALRDQIAAREAERSSDTEERRIVTILFTDIVGSSSLAEKMDPEDWRNTLSIVHEMAGEIVDQNGGRVLQYLGDGLLSAFGTKASSERDPERAIKSALEILSNLAALEIDEPLKMRAGVHTGLVVQGELGSYAKREFTASGDAMNLASRLQSAAPPDGVLISADTFRYVRGLFDMVLQPSLTLRGRQEPIQTYLVHRAKTHPYRMVTRGVGGVKTRTIGRKVELRYLHDLCQEAIQNKLVIWNQILGEPGVGKTRILMDLAESLELLPTEFHWLKTQAVEGDSKQPFALVRRMWFEQFQIAEDSPIDEAESKWVKGILNLHGAGFEQEAHVLGLLVGLPFEGSSSIQALRHDPLQMKGHAFAASRELLKQIRRTAPVVILVEDLQWADQASWDYLTQVIMGEPADEDPGNSLLVLATARPEWKPPGEMLSQSGYRQLELAALGRSDTHNLVKELLQRAEIIPDEIVQLIVERSEGVPYFAEEIINWFIDRGILDHHYEPWRFVPSLLDETPLPETLQHLLTTRMSSLMDFQNKALQHASVFGRNFWESGLYSLGISPSEELLEGLEQRGFIEAQPLSAFIGEREWRFHHNLMRDVAYETLLRKKRPELHKAAAAWLESHAQKAGRLEEFAGVLGDHLERAGELSEAADWYLRAGERAWSQGAVIESREFYDRTIELLPPNDRERLWRVLLDRDEVFGLLGEVEKRRADGELLLELAMGFDEPERIAEVYYRRGVFFQSLGDDRMALTAFGEAAASAKLTENIELEMKSVAWSVLCHTRRGNLSTAADLADTALSALDQITDESTKARIMTNVAAFFTESGDLAKAAHLYECQIEINERRGDMAGEAIGLGNMGYIYMQMGMFERAHQVLGKSLGINETLGARRYVAYNLLNLGLAHSRTGNHDRAKELIERAQTELKSLGDKFAIGVSHTYLGLCREHSRNTSSAIESYGAAQDMMKEAGIQGFMQDTTAGLARCKLKMGVEGEALDYALELWFHLQNNGAKGLEFPILAYQTCTSVFKALGDDEKSKTALEEGRNELMRRAGRISDDSWRKSFLENVPEHRALSEKWDRRAEAYSPNED